MTDIRDRLRDADPLLDDPELSADDVAAMRRTVVAAVQPGRGGVRLWPRSLAIAAVLALITVAGIDSARRSARPRELPAPAAAESGGTGRTQLHFSTPGGTRIIWTIDPAFHLTEKR